MNRLTRSSQGRFSACLALAILLATAGTSVALVRGVHTTATPRAVPQATLTIARVSVRLRAVTPEHSNDAGELPEQLGCPDCAMIPVRAVRVSQSRPVRRPAPPFTGGSRQHLRI